MTQNKKIAVTGGIGSGKSAVCEILREMGYAVFSCDEISRELWKEEDYREGLSSLFPACTRAGEIDKALLTSLVFSDDGVRKTLDGYSHPRIMERLLRRADAENIAFCEVPLLFEGGYEGMFDKVIAVVRDENRRIASVCERDGTTAEEVKRRIRSQVPATSLSGRDCLILENNGSKEDLREKLTSILRFLKIEKGA